ncbi:styrene monooxygenase/indole monooxygenase family protein [Nocardia sp. CA-290969]|uniref:styrene monooxygenase/indole monooxygenase family protein n=1 Tax=Nocardia sp. CA-290969 TaxID=3239986 RepID=UPI003D910FBC
MEHRQRSRETLQAFQIFHRRRGHRPTGGHNRGRNDETGQGTVAVTPGVGESITVPPLSTTGPCSIMICERVPASSSVHGRSTRHRHLTAVGYRCHRSRGIRSFTVNGVPSHPRSDRSAERVRYPDFRATQRRYRWLQEPL